MVSKDVTLKNRAVPLQHCANKAKVTEIEQYMSSLQGPMNVLKQEFVNSLKRGERLHKLTVEEQNIGRPDWLTGRQWKNLEATVYSTFQSWLEVAVRRGRTIINEWKKSRNLSDEEVYRLRQINKSQKWWDVEDGCEELAKAILKIHKFPVFKKPTTITLDSLTCSLSPTSFSEGGSDYTEHQWWLAVELPGDRLYKTADEQCHNVIRGIKGNRMYIPIFLDSYYLQRAHNANNVTNLFQLSIKDGELFIKHILQEEEVFKPREDGTDIAADWGLNSLLSINDGKQLGREFGSWLRARDEELINLEKDIKRNGIPLKKSKRRKKILNRIREHTRNEIGRVLNMLSREDIQSITVEDLDFRHGGLSRTLNRVMTKVGRRAFKNKLKDLEESYGIVTYEVNPAYTSQECSKCHFVFDKNRKGGVFECLFCGHKKQADLQASDNIALRRSQHADGYKYVPRNQILALRDQEFKSLWGFHPDVVRERYRDVIIPSGVG